MRIAGAWINFSNKAKGFILTFECLPKVSDFEIALKNK